MTDISPHSLRMLRKIKSLGYLPEDQLPRKLDRNRLKFLVNEELIDVFTLIPPGEEGYECGLVAYKLSPKGEDAIYKFQKVRFEARIALILSVISLIISLITTFSPIDDWVDSFFKTTNEQQR